MLLGLLLISLAVPGQAGLPALGDDALDQPVELTADLLRYESDPRRVIAEGHVVLRTAGGQQVIRADEVTYDPVTQVAEARGHVLLVSGELAGFADRLTVDLESRELSADNASFIQKRGVPPEVLATLDSSEVLAAAGQNAFSFSARRFRMLESGAYAVEDLSFTPCDCNLLEPSWAISASSAVIRPGERVQLTSPSVRVFGVPIFWFPWLDLPLKNRESGLLVPVFGATGLSGFQVEQPLFLALGRSYDVTLAPGYAFGQEPTNPALGSLGVRGPWFSSEFRYAPTVGMNGRAWLRLFYDLKQERNPLFPFDFLPENAERRGLRGQLELTHEQLLGAGLQARADVRLFSDGYLFADTDPAGGLARSIYYIPSTATVFRRGVDSYAGLALRYRQDVRWGFPLFGSDEARPSVFQEVPSLLYAIPAVPLGGPFSGSLQVELSRLSPLGSRLGDEGTDGVYWPLLPDADGTQGNGRFDPGERQARTRLDLLPKVNASFDVGGLLRVTPYVAFRESLYLYEVTEEARHRAYGLAGVYLDTELSRVYGGGERAVRHSITPSVEARWVPRVFGDASPPLYDEVDAAMPPEGILQALLALRQRLVVRNGQRVSELLRLDVLQGVDFREERLGETSGRLVTFLGPVTAEATARWDFFTEGLTERLTQLNANVRWSILPNMGVFGTYDRARASSERVRRTIDVLLPPPRPPPPAPLPPPAGVDRCSTTDLAYRPVDRILAGGNASFPFGLGLSYTAEVLRREPAGCDVLGIQSQTLGVSYSPSCNCWRIDAYARLLPPPSNFDYGLSVTLSGFGTFGR